MITSTNNCILCGGREADVIDRAGQYAILKCKRCDLVYVHPFPAEELLGKAYSEEYYTPWLGDQRNKRIGMWKKRLRTLNRFFVSKGSLLDIGCGECLFLELARKDGWLVTGTEKSSFAARYGREKLGLNIFQGELLDLGLPGKSFDAVTMWHVLEHTVNPLAVLKEARRILKDSGVFILAVPNLDNILSQVAYRLVKGRKMRLFTPEDRELHLYHFSSKTIKLALEQAGFEVRRIAPDMGIIQLRIRILNYAAKLISSLSGRIITDAIEVHALPVEISDKG